MNATLDLLARRKSVRAYADRPIPREEKDTILQAAMRAPTAGNMALYTILEIEDQAIKDHLAVICDNQPFIARAPYVLLFLADYQRWYDYYCICGVKQLCEQQGAQMRRPQEGDLLLACGDALIAAQSAVIAAEALGIGSCYIGDVIENYEIHRQTFSLPQYAVPIALLCFGYPTPEQAARPQTPRFEREFIVQKNTYRRLDAAGLERMFQSRNEQFLSAGRRKDGLENIGQFNYLRKFSSAFCEEMTRSTRAMIAAWKEELP